MLKKIYFLSLLLASLSTATFGASDTPQEPSLQDASTQPLSAQSDLLFTSTEQPFDAIINVGGDCQSAYQLYVNGLRKYALPFDKLITPYDALEKLLENDFEGFLDQENFELAVDEAGIKYILDKKYGTRFIHDFKCEEDFLKDYESVQETYLRRITRFFDVLSACKNPVFIRKGITKEQAVSLRDLLQKLYPDKSILIVALSGAEEIKEDWQLEGIQNFYLQQPTPYTWKGDPAAWQEIFKALGLQLSSADKSSSEI